MDHITIPYGAANLPSLEVPYLNNPRFTYDGLGFLDFPTRMGIDIGALPLGKVANLSCDDTAGFLQSWSFFALLAEFCKVGRVSFDLEKFLYYSPDGAVYVTTGQLPDLLREFELESRDLSDTERLDRFRICDSHLQAVCGLICDLGNERYSEFLFPRRDANHPLSVRHIIHFSAIVLGESLSCAVTYCYGRRVPRNWGESIVAENRMLQAGWCPSEIAIFRDQMLNHTSMYYFSMKDRTFLGRDHSKCLPMRCQAEDIKWEDYETKHVTACDCPRSWYDAALENFWIKSVSQVLRRDRIPLVTVGLSAGGQPYLNNPIEAEPGTIYVCISHVWSDGLGNDRGNSIPPCQLKRIQNLVNSLFPDSDEPIPFWMDTLCVPRRYPDRGIAISLMRDIYAGARKILVLDAVLDQLPVTSSAINLLMGIRSTTWVRRVWTFHEAALAKEIYYQFQDSALTSLSIYRISGIEELERSIEFYTSKGLSPSILDDSVVTIVDEMGSNPSTIQNVNVLDRLMFLNPIIMEGNIFTSKIEAKFETGPLHDYQRLRLATLPLRWRRTSRMEDEPICIAGIIGADVKSLVDLSPTERMKKLLGSLESVPTDILFLDKPRQCQDGYRWMPLTFLGMGKHPGTTGSQPAFPTPPGLLVTLDGLKLLPLVKPNGPSFPGRGQPVYFEEKGRLFSIVPLADNFCWDDYVSIGVTLILSDSIRTGTSTMAILVTTKDGTDGTDGIINCSLLCQAMVIGWTPKLQEQVVSNLSLTKLQRVSSQIWCVG